jgi:hypothetical protein
MNAWVETMRDEQNNKVVVHGGDPPNPLDFLAKDPLRETYEGRWSWLPLVQKAGVIIMLGFWCVFIAMLAWNGGKAQYLYTILVFASVMTLLVAFCLLLSRYIR